MSNRLYLLWQKIKKKLNKLLPVFLAVVLMFCSPLSGFAATSDEIKCQDLVWSSNEPHISIVDTAGTVIYSKSFANSGSSYDSESNTFTFGITDLTDASKVSFGKSSYPMDAIFIPDIYDYYFVITMSKSDLTDKTAFSYVPDTVRVRAYPCSEDEEQYNYLENLSYYHHDSKNALGFTVVGKLPETINSTMFCYLSLFDYSGGTLPANINFSGLIIAVQKTYTGEDINTAILSTLDDINSRLGTTNSLISSGNSSTRGIVSQFQSNLTDFNDTVQQFNDIENGFISDFTSANDEIKASLSDYSFTGNLLSCANWVTDTYMDFFNASGDFKQYFIYPLIIGIVLFFIGRGGVVLGNLYRKPIDTQSTTISTGYSYKDETGMRRSYKTTRTIKQGGKWRK